MQLYQQLTKTIKELGDLKLAWFTSFNMDIYFIEKYLLSAINQIPHEDIKSLRDYEVLNEYLHQREEGDKKVDIRFFYDFRANKSDDSKKTCVTLVPVDPSRLKSLDNKQFNGVFHPKIALLVNANNEGYILATSANLSLSAWARNSECAIFKKIEDKRNGLKIVDFFKVFTSAEEQKLLDEISSNWNQKLKDEADWSFLSSFDEGGLLNSMAISKTDLVVWSPYFSDDLPEIIENQLPECQIKLIPDVIEQKKVRITPETLEKINRMENVTIYKDDFDFKEESKPFVHAKTWLTPHKLAVGSWNFTNAGLNLKKINCNVEAGIIQNLTVDQYQKFCSSIKISPFNSYIGTEQSILQEERDQLLSPFTLSCRLFADWETFKYSVIDLPENINPDDYIVNLPGNVDYQLSQLQTGEVSFLPHASKLLKDRIFTIFREDKLVFSGLLTELNTERRPAFGYENLNDLLNAWLSDKAHHENGKQVLMYDDDSIDADSLNEKLFSAMSSDYSQGWFSMFVAMENIRQKILSSTNDQKALKLHAFQIPGCLSQLYEHTLILKRESESENIQNVSRPFLWFVINEVNKVLGVFNNKIEDKQLCFSMIENIPLHKYTNVDAQKAEKWLNQIKKDCYVS